MPGPVAISGAVTFGLLLPAMKEPFRNSLQNGASRPRRVWITGASSGIGAAAAVRLARAGARLALLGRDSERLDAVRRGLADPQAHVALAADVRDPAAMRAAAAAIERELGGIDALVASAGIAAFGPLEALADDEVDALVATNLTGVVHTLRAALPLLRAAESPGATARRVVLVGSASARRGVAGLAVYSATKAALLGLADALRLEWDADRIEVSVVNVRAMRTRLFERAFGMRRDAPAGAEDPDVAARSIERALECGDPYPAEGLAARCKAALNAAVPGLYDRWLRDGIRRRARE